MPRVARMLSRSCLFGCASALVGASTATAQNAPSTSGAVPGEIHCSATAMVPIVRIEGTSELVGDVVITCHDAGPAGRSEPGGSIRVDVSLSLNVSVGNRADFGFGSDVVDAVLVVNEKHCPAVSASSSFDGCGLEGATVQNPMLAHLATGTTGTFSWSGVAMPIPGAATGGDGLATGGFDGCRGRFGVAEGCHPPTTTMRLTNIRVNASQLGASGRTTGASVPVQATLAVRSTGRRVRLSGSPLRLADAATGLSVRADELDFDRLCSHGEASAEIALSEGFASAFKAVGEASLYPGQTGWQDAFYPHSDDDAGPSYLSSGTRIRVGLSGIPAGVSVSVPSSLACESGAGGVAELAMVEGSSPSGLGGTVLSGPPRDRTLRVTEDSEARAVYEVRSTDPLGRETCSIPVRFSRPTPATGRFEGGTMTASASLAPFGLDGASPPRNDRLRFARVKVRADRRLRLARCGTTLFFPFVTNRSSFDTAIVIANTSADPLGTRHQSGQCILRYHGSGIKDQAEPSIQRSAVIDAGEHLAFTLLNGRPDRGLVPLTDFQGFLVAECGFQHAYGFAFVTEQVNGTPILAQGYFAEVIEDSAPSGPVVAPP